MFEIIEINFKIKKVNFNNKIKVILVPTLRNVSFKNELWWTEHDLDNARRASFTELNTLIQRHPKLDFKEAQKLLYQPLSYDKNNFIYN
jgi:hypothetical protein